MEYKEKRKASTQKVLRESKHIKKVFRFLKVRLEKVWVEKVCVSKVSTNYVKVFTNTFCLSNCKLYKVSCQYLSRVAYGNSFKNKLNQ